jgi:hypothetical protein
MGGMAYIAREERERLFKLILSGDYKFVAKLIGTDNETGQPVEGAYALFENLGRKKIINYANKTAAENNIKLSKIEIWALDAELLKEVPWEEPAEDSEKNKR